MTVSTTVINYGTDRSTECGGVLFEIPETDVVGGMNLEIRLWGNSLEALVDYTLFKGTVSMGAGTLSTTTAKNISELVDFDGTYKYQADYPIKNIVSITAITEILVIESDGNPVTWASKGQTITSSFSRVGYSCVGEVLNTLLYGTVKLVYERTPYLKVWHWLIPTGSEGSYWFFIYLLGTVKNKFNISLPDLTSGFNDESNKNILLHIVAKGSEISVVGASVYVDDYFIGITDSSGNISILDIPQGTHTLKVSANGYISTDLDTLYNDTFTVY